MGLSGRAADAGSKTIEINGLWGLEFGNGESAGPKETLYFTAGPHTWHDESEEDVRGLFGTITVAG